MEDNAESSNKNELSIKDFTHIRNKDYEEKRVIFNPNNYHDYLKNSKLDLKINDIFEIPKIETVTKIFKKKRKDFMVFDKIETSIDITEICGNKSISLIRMNDIEDQLEKIQDEEMKYVYLAGIQISMKAHFNKGIDTPLEIAICDDRIIEPVEKSIIAQFTGNLIYQYCKFTICPDFTINLNDKNIEKSLRLYWKLTGITLEEGSKVMSVSCKTLWIISNKHEIYHKRKIDRISIESPFKNILKPIKQGITLYNEIKNYNDTSIKEERILNREIVPFRQSFQRFAEQKEFFIRLNYYDKMVKVLINLSGHNSTFCRELIHKNDLIKNGYIQKGLTIKNEEFMIITYRHDNIELPVKCEIIDLPIQVCPLPTLGKDLLDAYNFQLIN